MFHKPCNKETQLLYLTEKLFFFESDLRKSLQILIFYGNSLENYGLKSLIRHFIINVWLQTQGPGSVEKK